MYEFRWNWWNREHIAEHGVSPAEAEWVVNHARRPYPERTASGKYLVRGTNREGEYLQVVFTLDAGGDAYVIHARPLRDHEKRRYRRRLS